MDKIYWENYYKVQNTNYQPSLFAQYVCKEVIKEHRSLIELGCGNGRDAIFFANNGIEVIAVDQCENEINFLNYKFPHLEKCIFKTDDFTQLSYKQTFDIVYSRFTLHSIPIEQEQNVCQWAYQILNKDGVFCIEVRGQKNEIFGKGVPVKGEKDAFIYDNHYRRFLNFNKLCEKLFQLGFLLEYANEKKGFAPFLGKNETFIRIIAKKQ